MGHHTAMKKHLTLYTATRMNSTDVMLGKGSLTPENTFRMIQSA